LTARPAAVTQPLELNVFRHAAGGDRNRPHGQWVSPQNIRRLSRAVAGNAWWWLPPVVWPAGEAGLKRQLAGLYKNGARRFVLNAPWQPALFRNLKGLKLWAGPFCNLANPLALAAAQRLGMQGAIVSPELGREDYLKLPRHSPLPLGVVVAGHWPLCVSRTLGPELQAERPFFSPKGEQSWAARYGSEVWLFPNWEIDLKARQVELRKAGYQLFVHLHEPVPKAVKMKKRPGLWNYDHQLL
jgi:putative protease